MRTNIAAAADIKPKIRKTREPKYALAAAIQFIHEYLRQQ
jgi:hypothetical protein